MSNAYRVKLVLLALFVWGGMSLHADPPTSPKNFWKNSNYYHHYIMYEKSSATWVETINCNVAYRFTKVSSNLNELVLYDASRKLYVKLSYDGMWLKAANEANFTFYQKGTFEKRIYFYHQDTAGKWTGTLTRKNGCVFEELLAGGSKPSYYFKAFGGGTGQDFLYDSSRNMRVRLDATEMWLQPSGQPQYGFFKRGYWTE